MGRTWYVSKSHCLVKIKNTLVEIVFFCQINKFVCRFLVIYVDWNLILRFAGDCWYCWFILEPYSVNCRVVTNRQASRNPDSNYHWHLNCWIAKREDTGWVFQNLAGDRTQGKIPLVIPYLLTFQWKLLSSKYETQCQLCHFAASGDAWLALVYTGFYHRFSLCKLMNYLSKPL